MSEFENHTFLRYIGETNRKCSYKRRHPPEENFPLMSEFRHKLLGMLQLCWVARCRKNTYFGNAACDTFLRYTGEANRKTLLFREIKLELKMFFGHIICSCDRRHLPEENVPLMSEIRQELIGKFHSFCVPYIPPVHWRSKEKNFII